jgi:uncharacterized protein (DUF58 family)
LIGEALSTLKTARGAWSRHVKRAGLWPWLIIAVIAAVAAQVLGSAWGLTLAVSLISIVGYGFVVLLVAIPWAVGFNGQVERVRQLESQVLELQDARRARLVVEVEQEAQTRSVGIVIANKSDYDAADTTWDVENNGKYAQIEEHSCLARPRM